MSVHGTAIVTVDGVEFQSVPGTVNFNPGLTTSNPRLGPRGFVGGSVKPAMSTLTCDLIPKSDFDPTALVEGKEVTVQVMDISGQGGGWIVPRMVVTESPDFSDGDDAKWSISLGGDKAERI